MYWFYMGIYCSTEIFSGVAVEIWGEMGWNTGFHCWALTKERQDTQPFALTPFGCFMGLHVCSLRDLDDTERCIPGVEGWVVGRAGNSKITGQEIWYKPWSGIFGVQRLGLHLQNRLHFQTSLGTSGTGEDRVWGAGAFASWTLRQLFFWLSQWRSTFTEMLWHLILPKALREAKGFNFWALLCRELD